MPHEGPYEFRLAKVAVDACVPDDHLETIERGEWAWVDAGVKGYGWILMHRCPDCGQFGTLWVNGRGHTIDGQGNVSPSVLHGYKVAGVEKCGFHSHPTKLLGFVDKR
jgi:hypothetical protein